MQMLVLTRRLLPMMHAQSLSARTQRPRFKVLTTALRRCLLACIAGGIPQLQEGADILLPDRQLRVLLMMAWGYNTEQIGNGSVSAINGECTS